jgi:hypothetical protein
LLSAILREPLLTTDLGPISVSAADYPPTPKTLL